MPAITVDDTIAFLNELVALGEGGVLARLIEKRTWCTKALEDHPTVQIAGREDRVVAGRTVKLRMVGFLGILNGLFGTISEGEKKGWGYIAAVYESDGTLSGFRRTDDEAVKPVLANKCAPLV